MNKTSCNNQKAFTLVELMLVVGIFAFVLAGMLQLFIYTSISAELSGNQTMAMSEAQSKLEEIRNTTFDDIVSTYTASGTFGLDQLNGVGAIYIDSSNSSLLEVDVVVSWEDKYQRIIGEDLNLNGTLDIGEDVDGDGRLSSPVRLMSLIAER